MGRDDGHSTSSVAHDWTFHLLEGLRFRSVLALTSERRHLSFRLEPPKVVVRTFLLFAVSAFAELLGGWLVWQGIREQRGWVWIGVGIVASGVYPLAATLQSEPDFGRVLAAYGGVFIAAAFVWGAVFDGFLPDRFDVAGELVCLLGVSVIMFGPR